jgi:transposase
VAELSERVRNTVGHGISTDEDCLSSGATLRYLPKYSPDLNPIEMPYSKFKQFLRKVAARTVPGLTRAIRSFIPQLSPQECANYFRHAGYASI